jgi:Xaa-Pro aminopeptidase
VYPHQLERLTAALERGPFDALVAASPANVAYVTGFWSLSRAVYPATEIYAVVAPAGTALVVPSIDWLAVVEAGVDAAHVVTYGRFVLEHGAQPPRELPAPRASAADAVAAALEALGVRHGRLGVDDARLPATSAQALADRLGGFALTPASEALAAARAVKSPYEIDCLRRSLHVAEESIDAVLGLLRPGVTEREAATAFEHEVTRRGAAPSCTIIAFGPGSAVPAPWPTDRALRLGDLVRFDLGCVLKGYWSDVARMAVMGEPSTRQQEVFDALYAGLEAALDTARPEIGGGAVFDAAVKAARAKGLPRFDRHHVGHGIGLEAAESPWLAPDGGSLEMGMVVRVETPYYVIGEAGLNVKETALVTRTGAHVLNRSHRGLVVLD